MFCYNEFSDLGQIQTCILELYWSTGNLLSCSKKLVQSHVVLKFNNCIPNLDYKRQNITIQNTFCWFQNEPVTNIILTDLLNLGNNALIPVYRAYKCNDDCAKFLQPTVIDLSNSKELKREPRWHPSGL